ncbi:MAG TPA: DUF308 domain-containing protein [Solirubrobacteraceae bacterium]|nr:DUF308 domain-containing protein [Solirubrobacteraceae bacterium]
MDSTDKYFRGLGTAGIIAGVIGIVCGLVAIIWPKIPLLTLAIVAGLYLLCLGVLSMVRAFAPGRDGGARALSAVLGLLGVFIGIVVIRRPGDTVLVIVIAVGLWLVCAGVVEAVVALVTPGYRLVGFLTAAADIILGLLILSWPKASVATVAILVGIAFVLRGLLMVYAGFQLRRGEVPVDTGHVTGAGPPPLAV